MSDIGKFLVLAGIGIAIIGVLAIALGRLGFRGLPGDMKYQSDHVGFYFPIVTCIVLSILLTLAGWLYRWITRR